MKYLTMKLLSVNENESNLTANLLPDCYSPYFRLKGGHRLRLSDLAYKINTGPQEDKKLRRKTIKTINAGEMTYISVRSIRGCNCCRLM